MIVCKKVSDAIMSDLCQIRLCIVYSLCWLHADVMDTEESVNENEADSLYAVYTQIISQ